MPKVIHRIPTTDPATYAFSIDGKVTADEMEAMGEEMNAAFDLYDKVNMLLIFEHYDGSEVGAGLDWESIKSRFRSLTSVDKYVAVGAPEDASAMIEAMGSVIPVEAKTFEKADLDAAWAYVGARPA
ncbi:STAS/SEC14 domain-containing protein [Jannaschia sp. 2305UL9-9]|uniref:STAS/SEC14 domain-containing protein n=1 Tax=Jannaschia sp. 2305UL9-9 TaxID=3121638 RepID=UPI003528DCBF